MIRPASRLASETRRGIILLVVISFLTLFAVIGLSFVLYATSASTAARYFRESHSQRSADLEPELLFAYFLGQFLYDVPDDATGVYSGLRGYGLCRTDVEIGQESIVQRLDAGQQGLHDVHG